jgi:hypothetical protein
MIVRIEAWVGTALICCCGCGIFAGDRGGGYVVCGAGGEYIFCVV